MNKRPVLVYQVLLAIALIFSSCQTEEEVPVLTDHLQQYPHIQKKYIYQSLIRLANIQHDPDFDKLIRDIDKIILYMPPREDSTYQIKTLRTALVSAAYEQLIDFRSASGERISLWVNESGSQPHYIGLLDSDTSDYIFEVSGQINLEYISSLTKANESTLRGLIN